jgi:hypothetical protein
MKQFLNSLDPEDLLALLVAAGCLILKGTGHGDMGTDQLMTSVITYRLGSHTKKSSEAKRVRGATANG